MKNSNAGLCATVVVVFGALLATASPLGGGQQLLGAKKCTWGPAYWCGNLTNAKDCNAVRHCIQTVWENQEVPVDDDSICKICKDMVTQARDQLRSNETMEELKEVFEGSCNLIPIKVVKKECCKLADDFIPELVEALSSQMNPDQVCSVAGLCNNAEIDHLLMTYYSGALDGTLTEDPSTDAPANPTQDVAQSPNGRRPLSCGKCNNIATYISEKFQSTNRDDILENLLHLCGEMSSFSDACSNIVLTYFNDIYDHMKQHLDASGICHISGVCASKYHQHPEDAVEVEEISDLGAMSAEVDGGDDIPCELCQQLVHHLRDLLVANTTEDEFKQVMEGLCKQTKGFKEECLSIVDQYYDVIYHSLVDNLDANGACFMMGVCPKTSSKQSSILDAGIMPLLPAFPPAEIKVTIRKKLGANEPKFTQDEIMSMQLPIDHLMGAANPETLVEGGELCVLCEYLLHFMQETLATPATEDEIKADMKKICTKMPKSMSTQCQNFVDIYGDAMVSLMVQELDPRQICPMMKLCPSNNPKREDMEVFAPEAVSDSSDKPTCPLCLFAVEQAQQKIKDDKSKKNIRDVLDHLCVHLPQKLQAECVDFVETYSNELIDMLITDFKPQEICTALRLCPKRNTYLRDFGISMEEEDDTSNSDESFNEIEDSNEMPVEIIFEKDLAVAPNCWLCEEFVKNAEKKIGKNKSKAEIKKALEHSCDKLRKNVQKQCHTYVEKYGDKIATLIIKEMEPKMICRELGLCLWSEQEDLEIDEALKYDVIAMPNEKYNSEGHSERLTALSEETLKEPPTCVLCEFVMTKMESELKNKTTQDEIKHVIETICDKMPKTVSKSCDKFVEQYANAIIALIGSVPPKEVCQKLQLCFAGLDSVINDEVIECGVCHGVSVALLPFFRQHRDHSAIEQHDMVSVGCEDLPAKYYQICSEMIHMYGPSILHLAQRDYVDEAHVCAEIGKCFDNESSGSAFARISA